jgi:DNA-directed RNA polymerase subunit beta'
LTGITKNIVMDWRQGIRGESLRPALALRTPEGQPVKLESGGDARYDLAMETVVLVSDKKVVQKGDVVARLAKEVFKSRDITGGLPRITELFEARRPKDPAVTCEYDGHVDFGKDYKTRRRLMVVPHDATLRPVEYLVTKGRHVLVQQGDQVKKGDILVDGSPVPHDILNVLGVESMAHYLIKEIQDVYRLQGVTINDKHIEVIIRQMLRKMEIVDPGETTFLVGDQVSQEELTAANEEARREGRGQARAMAVLQGITKASLKTESFISAASFQETTRVLIEAAIQGKEDHLLGLKENVIAGRLIPAGTGVIIAQFKREARLRDLKILEEAKNRQQQDQVVGQ